MSRKRAATILILSLLGAAIVGGSLWRSRDSEPADTRFSGAYAMSDGAQVFISPNAGTSLRYKLMNGEAGVIWPVGGNRYSGGSGWEVREPVTNKMAFTVAADSRASDLTWEQSGRTEPQTGRRIDLPERIVVFSSGRITLRGKLVKPLGEGPFPAVVMVHGADRSSAADCYTEPYLYAANGFATLVFDKRGTGASDGEYLQNFSVLADDVVAAVDWLRDQDHIDDDRINLAGFSMGGWVAPLAAMRDGRIRSMLIGYGPLVPVAAEDRWGYVHALQESGFGLDVIADADRVNAVIEDISAGGKNRWGELAVLIDEARHELWAETVSRSDSSLGRMLATKEPMWLSRLFYWWHVGRYTDPPFIQWSYDPVPTMASLTTPSLWLLGGEDSSMPTQWTLAELDKLRALGRPIESKIFPHAEHGMIRIEEVEGHRRAVGHEPNYFPSQIEWLRKHNLN